MKQRSILGRVAVPLLIYYGISLVITMFASAIVAGLKMPQYLNGQVEYAQMVTEMTNDFKVYDYHHWSDSNCSDTDILVDVPQR